MNPEARFRELLSKLLDDDFNAGEREELACLCDGEESFRDSLRDELELDELIRHAASAPEVSTGHFSRSLESRISGEMPDFDTLTGRLIESEAAPHEIDEIVRRCWREEENAIHLHRELKWAELFEQAASPHRSEESFVEALATRMWAEQDQDHFVEQTQSKIVNLFPDSVEPPEPKAGGSRIITIGTWATAAAAAIALASVYLVSRPGPTVAEVVHVTDDVQWRELPADPKNLAKGSYSLDAGVVTLEFPNGAEMTIEGPAEFDLRGENEAFVHTGIAMLDQDDNGPGGDEPGASSPKSGFTLQSRGLNFGKTYDTVGIDARSATSTEAVVFKGGAEVCLPAIAGSCRNLYDYEAVRADLKREKLFDVPYNPKVFARSWEVLAGVESNTGSIRIELPGEKPEQADSGDDEVQIFVERDRFVADRTIEVDTLDPGQFASLTTGAAGIALEEKGEIRSYLLQLWPESSDQEDSELEASVTFAHEVVGVIFSSDRLERSDSIVGSEVANLDASVSSVRGLDASGADGDSILLSSDRRTVNLRLQSGTEKDQLDHVRVLVALR